VARGVGPSTSREDVARAALDLFSHRQGYDETTVDQIAAAVGVSRRTFFRYYESKRDVVWGEFDAELVRLRDELGDAARLDQPMMDVLRQAVIATNRFGAGSSSELRIRIVLISTVPTLVAHSAVRYAEWCEVVAGFVAGRIGGSVDDLGPQTVARAALGRSHGRLHLLGRRRHRGPVCGGGSRLPTPRYRLRPGSLGPMGPQVHRGWAGRVSPSVSLSGPLTGPRLDATGPMARCWHQSDSTAACCRDKGRTTA
jgi:mycofactocin system transcriptional regulator